MKKLGLGIHSSVSQHWGVFIFEVSPVDPEKFSIKTRIIRSSCSQ